MTRVTHQLCTLMPLIRMLLTLLYDGLRFLRLCLRPSPALAAENFFLRKQLALYQERHIEPQRPTDATRLSLLWLARWFDWRHALVLVQPATMHARLDLEQPAETTHVGHEHSTALVAGRAVKRPRRARARVQHLGLFNIVSEPHD